MIHLYKNKGDRASCDNHRGISLLSVAGKIMARVILNRITQYLLDDVVSESQCGFRRYRGTIDMIFAVRQIQEKCREQNMNLYILFVDLTKAFDTVSRGGLWAILSKLGCPERFVSIIRSFHEGMMARVIEHGAASDPFPVSNGVKQGCVLAPTLFSLLFATMLFAALSKTSSGINVRYRCDGRFFDLRRLKAKTKVLEALVRDFLFADDCALVAVNEPDLQELASCLSEAAKAFALTISLRKTEVMLQPAPGLTPPPEPSIVIEGTKLSNVECFTYLGSTLTSTRQYGQGSVKQTGEGRCVFWPTVDTSVEGTWHQVAYQTGSVQGCSHDIPALWLRDIGSLQEAVEDSRPVSPPMHAQDHGYLLGRQGTQH